MPTVTPVNLDSPRVKQLSDQGSSGTILGASATDPIGFYGLATGVVQPSGNAQAAITRGLAAGSIITFASSQSPNTVAPSTTVQFNMTVQSGVNTQSINTPLAADLFFVNKPTSQAGLSVGNVRGVSQNVVGVSFGNLTATTITPTASEGYSIIALRGMTTISATLSPAAVAANTTVEQLFTATGIRAGELVQVNKPTVQAGLEIVGCRAAANNQIGITFANYTAASITPTASEAYTVFSLGGLDAVNNEVVLGAALNPTSVQITTTQEFAATVAGLTFGDVVKGVSKPTQQAALFVGGGGRVSVPSTIGITFGNIGVTTVTPTANEVYEISLSRVNPVAPLLIYNTVLTAPTSVPALSSAEQTFTVTGLIASTPVWVNKPTAQAGLGIAGVRVSAVNTLAINYINTSLVSITPTAAETYVIGNFQDATPTTGNSISKSAVQVIQSAAILANATRSALTTTGFVAGA